MKPLFAMAAVALLVFAALALDVPSRIAALGSGNLARVTAPTTTVAFGQSVELDGRAERPPLEVRAQKAVLARSLTRGVRPVRGSRFVSVDLSITNLGSKPFVPGPGRLLELVDQHGATYANASRFTRLRRARVLSRPKPLGPKQTMHGVVVFEVPRWATVTKIRLTVGSGFTRTAEWVAADKVR